MHPQAERKGENEILYREVNERVRELHEDFELDDYGKIQFVCECARLDCTERIELTKDEYEQLRASGRRFAVSNGHQDPTVEFVVAENDRFTTIEKDAGGPAELAEREDPR